MRPYRAGPQPPGERPRTEPIVLSPERLERVELILGFLQPVVFQRESQESQAQPPLPAAVEPPAHLEPALPGGEREVVPTRLVVQSPERMQCSNRLSIDLYGRLAGRDRFRQIAIGR